MQDETEQQKNGTEIGVVFCDPPRTRNRQQGVEGKYDAILTLVKNNRGKWARVMVTDNSRTAHSLNSTVKNTPRYKNLASPGKFEVVTRRIDNDEEDNKQYGVWVRYSLR